MVLGKERSCLSQELFIPSHRMESTVVRGRDGFSSRPALLCAVDHTLGVLPMLQCCSFPDLRY